MQTIEQLLSTVIKLKTAAKDVLLKATTLSLSAEDEQTLLIEEWKKNPAKAAPDVRKIYKTFAGFPVAWDAKTTTFGPMGIKPAAKAAPATKASPAAKAPIAKPAAPKVAAPKVAPAVKAPTKTAPTPSPAAAPAAKPAAKKAAATPVLPGLGKKSGS